MAAAAPHEPTYFEHPLDDAAHHQRFRPRPRPGPPPGITVTVIVLVIVLGAAFLYSVRAGFHGVLPGASGPQTVVADGAAWQIGAQDYWVQEFSASPNGTLYGNFTSNGDETNVLLLNQSEMNNFTANITNAEFYSTGPVRLGGMAWEIPIGGAYFLIGWNEQLTPVTLTWVTTVQYVE